MLTSVYFQHHLYPGFCSSSQSCSLSLSRQSGCCNLPVTPAPPRTRQPPSSTVRSPLCASSLSSQETRGPGRPGRLDARRGSTGVRSCESRSTANALRTPSVPTSEQTPRTCHPGARPPPPLSTPPACRSRLWWLPARPRTSSQLSLYPP